MKKGKTSSKKLTTQYGKHSRIQNKSTKRPAAAKHKRAAPPNSPISYAMHLFKKLTG